MSDCIGDRGVGRPCLAAQINERLPDLELKVCAADTDFQRGLALACPDLASDRERVRIVLLERRIRPLLLQLPYADFSLPASTNDR